MFTQNKCSIFNWGNDSPKIYMAKIQNDIESESNKITSLKTINKLNENLKMHCIPVHLDERDASEYSEFLVQRRQLMAQKIKDFYKGL